MHRRLSQLLTLLHALLRGGLRRRSGGRFATGVPSAQNAIDAVSVPWASRLPVAETTSGTGELFGDPRVTWAIQTLGGVAGASCLELGPLEGGHSFMLQEAGAAHVRAVEANKDAFLKCLVTKELLDLDRCSFLCGDVMEYLRSDSSPVDVCWCAGILYHMTEPVELLELISSRASRLYIWTHYYDEIKLSAGDDKSQAFAGRQKATIDRAGFQYTLHRHNYGVATRLGAFWGGVQAYSNWLSLPDLLGALEHFGWHVVQTQIDADHPHGPSVNLVAVKRN
jgi:hypothetical protein